MRSISACDICGADCAILQVCKSVISVRKASVVSPRLADTLVEDYLTPDTLILRYLGTAKHCHVIWKRML